MYKTNTNSGFILYPKNQFTYFLKHKMNLLSSTSQILSLSNQLLEKCIENVGQLFYATVNGYHAPSDHSGTQLKEWVDINSASLLTGSSWENSETLLFASYPSESATMETSLHHNPLPLTGTSTGMTLFCHIVGFHSSAQNIF